VLTRTDIATFDARYRRFRAELALATRIDKVEFGLWIKAHGDALVRAFMPIAEDNTTMEDYETWLRWEFQQAHGRVV
jgi:hypothetical protein